jgi:myo-inositol catabolism protein IolC
LEVATVITGYEQPLYILPFDHRHSYITGTLHWQEPLTSGRVAEIVASKQVIYDGFTAAVAGNAMRDRTGILVDEAFGARAAPGRSGPRLRHVRLHRKERAERV